MSWKDILKDEDLTYCPNCGLNPNDHQSEEQQKWESDYVKEHGMCHYCINVGTGDGDIDGDDSKELREEKK